jgi:hypothetical protein
LLSASGDRQTDGYLRPSHQLDILESCERDHDDLVHMIIIADQPDRVELYGSFPAFLFV